MTDIKTNAIPHRQRCIDKEHPYIGGAKDIYDDTKSKSQQRINADVDDELADRYTKDKTYSKEQLNNLITTPEVNYVNVDATDQTTDVTDVLPTTGTANTIYKVGKWDGTQYNTGKYSEYAWDGTEYIHLATRDHGVDDEVIKDSPNLVTGAAVAKLIRDTENLGVYRFVFTDKDENISMYQDKNGDFHLLYPLHVENIDVKNISGAFTIEFVNSEYYDFLVVDKDYNIVLASTRYLGVIGSSNNVLEETSEQKEKEDSVYQRNIDKVNILMSDTVYGSTTSKCFSTGTSHGEDRSKRLQLMVVTDTHLLSDSFKNTVLMANDTPCVDAIIHLGDMTNYLNGTNDVYDTYKEIINQAVRKNKPLFMTPGNHDSGTASSLLQFCKNGTELYRRWIKPTVDRGWLSDGEYTENKCYYYHDFAKEKVRLIMLYPFDDGDVLDESNWKAVAYNESAPVIAEGTYSTGDIVNIPSYTDNSFQAVTDVTVRESPSDYPYGAAYVDEEDLNPSTKYHNLAENPRYKANKYLSWYGQDQIDWLIDKLEEAKTLGYTVIVAQHYSCISGADNTPAHGHQLLDTRFNNPYRNNSIEFEGRFASEDKNLIAQIANVYVNGGTLTKTVYPYGQSTQADRKHDYTLDNSHVVWGLDDATSLDVVNIDYTSEGGGKVLFLAGHNHSDFLVKSEEYNIMQIGFLCGTISDIHDNDTVRTTMQEKYADTMTGVTLFNDVYNDEIPHHYVHLTRLGIDSTIRVSSNGTLINKANEIFEF